MDKGRFCVGVDVGKDELVVAITGKKPQEKIRNIKSPLALSYKTR